ncbi:MAG: hypothetical protein QOE37_1211 [Microbacteriaceae bacterium]|nr:hypothetical protein [Microbacteriaceae bacterium]
MRRAPIVHTATNAGTAAVLHYKPVAAGSVTNSAATSGSSTSTSSSDGSSSASSSASGSSASASATPSASASSGSSGSSINSVVTGTAVTTRFGTTEVKVTIANGKLTDVTAVELNNADPRSYQISEYAAPTLRQEVLSKQSASVDTVSGATYTSLAYEASLQAALDKAGYTAPDGSKASTSAPAEGGR